MNGADMTTDTVEAAARVLVAARQERTPAPAARTVLTDAAAAYAVQHEVARALDWFGGATPRYWKSGGPSRSAVLTHAPLPPAGVWTSPADAGAWPFLLRGIEAEIALRLACDVDAELARSLDAGRAAALIDAMCVSIEIVDSRWVEGLDAGSLAKLADLQSHGALVLGAWVPFTACGWQTLSCRVRIGEQTAVERTGSHPMGDPVFVLPAWLAHATRNGDSVPAGTVVTTGSWNGILPAAPGDLVTAEFAGIGSASVQL